ncbi:MAG: hypothetical protein ACI9JN_002510 [Bacteroidia bacterium]|jgi:hypothetical protein
MKKKKSHIIIAFVIALFTFGSLTALNAKKHRYKHKHQTEHCAKHTR